MQAVFDGPMGAHAVLEAFGRERRAHDVEAGLGFRLPGGFAPQLDLAEGGQARSIMVLLQPCEGQAPLSRGDGVRDRLVQLVFAVLVEHLAAQSYHHDVRRADQRDSTMWRTSAFKEASRASSCSLSLALCLMPYQDACMRSQSCFAPGPEAGVRRVQWASISSSIAP